MDAAREITCRAHVVRRARCQALIVKPIGSAEVAASEVRVKVAMKLVGARLGNYVQDQVAGLSIFGVVVVFKNLELLDLFHRRSQRVACGSAPIGNISAVDVDLDAAVVDAAGANQIVGVAGVIVSDSRSRGSQALIVVRRAAKSSKRRRGRQIGNGLIVDYGG